MIMDIQQEVLRKIKPSHEETEKAKRFINQLTTVAKTVSGLDTVIVGSIGKFTWLSGDHDIDLFILFEPTVPREELERLGLEYGKRIVEELGGKWKVKYAEHPYTSAVVRGYDVDVVPCYRIRYGDKIKSAVDRSPLHLQYVLDHIKPAMVDNARLLKQFCKGIGVYGSDAKNQGFSGYICELLVLQYGSFDSVINAASEWKPPFTMNIEKHLGVNLSQFRYQPLVIVDPVDASRNVAAVVSGENFVKFAAAAKAYRQKPSVGFFFSPKKESLTAKETSQLQARETVFIAVYMKKPDVIDDVLYPQLRRALNRLTHLLEHHEFHVVRAFDYVGKDIALLFELETWSLPAIKKMTGPPIFSEKHTAEFISKYSKNPIYVSDNKWVAEVARKHKTAVKLLGSFLKDKPEALVEKGIPKYIIPVIAKSTILEHRDFWKLVKKDRTLSACIKEKYFSEYAKGFWK